MNQRQRVNKTKPVHHTHLRFKIVCMFKDYRKLEPKLVSLASMIGDLGGSNFETDRGHR